MFGWVGLMWRQERGCLWQWHALCVIILMHVVVVLHLRILRLCYPKKLMS